MNRKYQISLWGIVVFVALACGIGAYVYVQSTGADRTIAFIVLISVTVLTIALYAMFSTILEDFLGWLQKRSSASHMDVKSEEKRQEDQVIIPVEAIPTPKAEPSTKQPRQEITNDMIFMNGAYEKLERLEKRLIQDHYLSEDLEWLAMYNGRKSINPLIIFMLGLMEEKYFLPKRDSQIKTYFEQRYHISIKQNFEPNRREKHVGLYKTKFYDYPF